MKLEFEDYELGKKIVDEAMKLPDADIEFDDGACRVLADYRFKDISKLREEKLDFLLDE